MSDRLEGIEYWWSGGFPGAFAADFKKNPVEPKLYAAFRRVLLAMPDEDFERFFSAPANRRLSARDQRYRLQLSYSRLFAWGPGGKWHTVIARPVRLARVRPEVQHAKVHRLCPTSKWNKIEHRLFSYISTNWRGQPLVSLAVIVNLIGATRTAAGLRVRCELDRGAYPKGQDSLHAQMASLHLIPHAFHGDWNYNAPPRFTSGDDSFTYFLTMP